MAKTKARWIERDYTGDNTSTNPSDALWAGNIDYSTTQTIKAKIDAVQAQVDGYDHDLSLSDLNNVTEDTVNYATKRFLLHPAGAGDWANVAASDFKTALSLAKSDVGLSNVENTALSAWTGSTNITTVGLISSGTWEGSPVGVDFGGLGNFTTPTANYILKGDGTGWVESANGNFIVFTDGDNIISGINNANTTTFVSATKISTGIISNTEFDYLNGLTGNIQSQIDTHTHTLDGLSDVTITTPSSTQVLQYNGSAWVNASLAAGHTQNTDTGTNSESFRINNDALPAANTATIFFGDTSTTTHFLRWDGVTDSRYELSHSLHVTGSITATTNISGTWAGTTIGVAKGGTGTTTAPTAGQILVAEDADNYTPRTIGESGNIDVTASGTGITIGVASGYQIPTTTQVGFIHEQNTDTGTDSNNFNIGTATSDATLTLGNSTGSSSFTPRFLITSNASLSTMNFVSSDAAGDYYGNYKFFGETLDFTISNGVVTSGSWNGTAISVAKGGTGQTAVGTGGQVLATNAGATATEWKSLSTTDISGIGALTGTTGNSWSIDSDGNSGVSALSLNWGGGRANIQVDGSNYLQFSSVGAIYGFGGASAVFIDGNTGNVEAASFTGSGTQLTDLTNSYKNYISAAITSTQISTDKYISLPEAVVVSSNVVVIVVGGPVQEYGVDYTVDNGGAGGVGRVRWHNGTSSLGLDGQLAAGDKLIVIYQPAG